MPPFPLHPGASPLPAGEPPSAGRPRPRRRPGPAALRTRAGLAVVAAVAALVAGCGPAATSGAASVTARPTGSSASTTADGSAGRAATPTSVAPAAASSPSTGTRGSTAPRAHPGTALALLGSLVVKGRGPMTGYARDQFGPAWTDTDRNGCDQRNDVLRRDLRAIRLKAGTHGCVVLSGTLLDPYTGRTIAFTRGPGTSAAVQIDHVVPLADAWVKGAARWDVGTRTAFANDPLNLLAVSGPVNAAKGAGDAATWLPPAKGYRCAYAARQVAVKARYAVAVTAAERAALARILGTCPGTPVPTAAPVALGGWPVATSSPSTPRPVTSTGTSSPKPSTTSTSSVVQGVHPGAFCSPEGALGRTTAGTLMRCSTTATDPRARWRRA